MDPVRRGQCQTIALPTRSLLSLAPSPSLRHGLRGLFVPFSAASMAAPCACNVPPLLPATMFQGTTVTLIVQSPAQPPPSPLLNTPPPVVTTLTHPHLLCLRAEWVLRVLQCCLNGSLKQVVSTVAITCTAQHSKAWTSSVQDTLKLDAQVK